MKVADYADFVLQTDQYQDKKKDDRRAIALYGLVGEIGSLVAAVKKNLLAESGQTAWDQPSDEIKEELGDALWYLYSLSQITNETSFDILVSGIEALRCEISNEGERAKQIATTLPPGDRSAFLEAARHFPSHTNYSFDEYQRLAFKTARTDGQVLLEVCLAVLWQLGAELLRSTLPSIEISLNRNIADRSQNVILGEVAWHLSALASLYSLSLDDVVESNCSKVRFRSMRGTNTPLHDDDRDEKEQFPRKFDVTFVRIGAGRSRMYFEGKPLGADLTDNFYDDDGYRFHDVIHLALLAHLGWSPVIRDLMKRKRKSRNDRVDEVEDGGRAQIVEELVIKAIHSEGYKQARTSGRCVVGQPTQLFPARKLINFKLLKTLRMYVEGLEVSQNTFWEWEDAIFDGCEMFFRLSVEKQGTVHLDLVERKLTFSPLVSPSVQGITVGLGMASVSNDIIHDRSSVPLSTAELAWATEKNCLAETIAAKQAILASLGLVKTSPELCDEIEIQPDVGNRVYVRSRESVQRAAWELQAVDYKIGFSHTASEVACTATAIADIRDISK